MDAEAMPVIRLSVEHMKAQVLHHMGVIGSELGERMEQEIENAIESYPWQAQVNSIVHDAISEAIKSYFQYGKGCSDLESAINEALSKTFKD